jgi:putative membrane protein
MVAPALTDADRARIAAAVAAAESRTGVELRLVLAHASSHYGAFALIYPGLAALVAGGAAAAFAPDFDAAWLFMGQAASFGVALGLLQIPSLRRFLAPSAVKRKAAARQARLQYATIGLKLPHTHNAVLIFCSIAERYAEILVDDAIAEKLPESAWAPVVHALKADFASGAIAEGFVRAASACADLLAPEFPPTPGRINEIPDTLLEV